MYLNFGCVLYSCNVTFTHLLLRLHFLQQTTNPSLYNQTLSFSLSQSNQRLGIFSKNEEQQWQHKAYSPPSLHSKTRNVKSSMATRNSLILHNRISRHSNLHKRLLTSKAIVDVNRRRHHRRRSRKSAASDNSNQHTPTLRFEIKRFLPHDSRRAQANLRRPPQMLISLQPPRVRHHSRNSPLEIAEPQRSNRVHRRESLLRGLLRGVASGDRRLRRSIHDEDERNGRARRVR